MTGTGEIVLRLLLGAFLGGVVGYERYTHGRAAGLRTHLIVGMASVLIMIVSVDFHYLTGHYPDYIRIDPSRIAAGAITGIGFLGAGVIIRTGFTVQGLTTAACLWIVSAIGLAVGSGFYLPGIIEPLITVIALWLLREVETKINKESYRYIDITADSADKEKEIREILKEARANIANINYEYDPGSNIFNYMIMISVDDQVNLRGLLGNLGSMRRDNQDLY